MWDLAAATPTTFASVAVPNLRRSAGLVQHPTAVCALKVAVVAPVIALLVLRCTVVLLTVASVVHKLAALAVGLYVIMVQAQVLAVLKRMAVTSIALVDLVA